jgi:hypothetical protein
LALLALAAPGAQAMREVGPAEAKTVVGHNQFPNSMCMEGDCGQDQYCHPAGAQCQSVEAQLVYLCTPAAAGNQCKSAPGTSVQTCSVWYNMQLPPDNNCGEKGQCPDILFSVPINACFDSVDGGQTWVEHVQT